MNVQKINFAKLPIEEVKPLKGHMTNMSDYLRALGVSCKPINLNPQPEIDAEKVLKQIQAEKAKELKKKVTDLSEEENKSIEKEADKAVKNLKKEKSSGYWIIQGTHENEKGKTFNFQIVREHGEVKENGQPQYKILLQAGKDQCIATYPQTNSDLKGMIFGYRFNPTLETLTLVTEEKATEPKK
jgi:hypothetical protein